MATRIFMGPQGSFPEGYWPEVTADSVTGDVVTDLEVSAVPYLFMTLSGPEEAFPLRFEPDQYMPLEVAVI